MEKKPYEQYNNKASDWDQYNDNDRRTGDLAWHEYVQRRQREKEYHKTDPQDMEYSHVYQEAADSDSCRKHYYQEDSAPWVMEESHCGSHHDTILHEDDDNDNDDDDDDNDWVDGCKEEDYLEHRQCPKDEHCEKHRHCPKEKNYDSNNLDDCCYKLYCHCGHGRKGPTDPQGIRGFQDSTGDTGFITPYAYIYNVGTQIVAVETDITFSNNGIIFGAISHALGGSPIVVDTTGDYFISFHVTADSANQFALFINGILVPGSQAATSTGGTATTGSIIYPMVAGDSLTVRNHSSAINPVVLASSIGGENAITNAWVILEKIR